MTNSDIFPMYNITTGTVMLICAIDSLFVLQNPNLTQPTQIILVLKKQSPCLNLGLSRDVAQEF